MKIRIQIDQAGAFRKGINCPKSYAMLDIDPSSLDQPTRDIIANHLKGIDIVYNGERLVFDEPSIEYVIEKLKKLFHEEMK